MILVAASFIYIVCPREALALLKRLGLAVLVLILGAALLPQILAEAPAVVALLPVLLLVGLAAYCIREGRGRKLRQPRAGRGGVERTRMP